MKIIQNLIDWGKDFNKKAYAMGDQMTEKLDENIANDNMDLPACPRCNALSIKESKMINIIALVVLIGVMMMITSTGEVSLVAVVIFSIIAGAGWKGFIKPKFFGKQLNCTSCHHKWTLK